MSYITLSDLSNDLGIYEFEVKVTYPTGTTGDAGYVVGTVLTGQTNSGTMTILRIVSPTRFFVGNVVGTITIGEELRDADATSSFLNSADFISIQNFINRSVSIVESIIRRRLLANGDTHTAYITTKKGKNVYKVPAGKLPIISITSILLSGSPYTGVEGTDFSVIKPYGLLDFHDGSMAKETDRAGNLEIAYTYGEAYTVSTLPAIVVEAVIRGTIFMWERFNQIATAPGATNINPAGFSMSFKTEQLFSDDYIKLLQAETRFMV